MHNRNRSITNAKALGNPGSKQFKVLEGGVEKKEPLSAITEVKTEAIKEDPESNISWVKRIKSKLCCGVEEHKGL